MKTPYDPMNFGDMVEQTQDGADLEIGTDWDTVADQAVDKTEGDGHGNPLPASSLKSGAKLPDFLRTP